MNKSIFFRKKPIFYRKRASDGVQFLMTTVWTDIEHTNDKKSPGGIIGVTCSAKRMGQRSMDDLVDALNQVMDDYYAGRL